MNGWPSLSQYDEAVANQARCFSSADLREAVFVRFPPPLRSFIQGSGAFAAVMRATLGAGAAGSRDVAVRFFTLSQQGLEERYEALSKLENEASRYMGSPEFRSEEVTVENFHRRFPVVLVDWVPGKSLGEYTRELCSRGDVARIRALREALVQMRLDLTSDSFSHGDLSSDNVMVIDDGAGPTLQLVDLDSAWFPEIRSLPSAVGRGPLQHPACPEVPGLSADRMAFLIFDLALAFLEKDPSQGVTEARYENRFVLNVHDLLGGSDPDQVLVAKSIKEKCTEEFERAWRYASGAYDQTDPITSIVDLPSSTKVGTELGSRECRRITSPRAKGNQDEVNLFWSNLKRRCQNVGLLVEVVRCLLQALRDEANRLQQPVDLKLSDAGVFVTEWRLRHPQALKPPKLIDVFEDIVKENPASLSEIQIIRDGAESRVEVSPSSSSSLPTDPELVARLDIEKKVDSMSLEELKAKARELDVYGRSGMTKLRLRNAVIDRLLDAKEHLPLATLNEASIVQVELSLNDANGATGPNPAVDALKKEWGDFYARAISSIASNSVVEFAKEFLRVFSMHLTNQPRFEVEFTTVYSFSRQVGHTMGVEMLQITFRNVIRESPVLSKHVQLVQDGGSWRLKRCPPIAIPRDVTATSSKTIRVSAAIGTSPELASRWGDFYGLAKSRNQGSKRSFIVLHELLKTFRDYLRSRPDFVIQLSDVESFLEEVKVECESALRDEILRVLNWNPSLGSALVLGGDDQGSLIVKRRIHSAPSLSAPSTSIAKDSKPKEVVSIAVPSKAGLSEKDLVSIELGVRCCDPLPLESTRFNTCQSWIINTRCSLSDGSRGFRFPTAHEIDVWIANTPTGAWHRGGRFWIRDEKSVICLYKPSSLWKHQYRWEGKDGILVPILV